MKPKDGRDRGLTRRLASLAVLLVAITTILLAVSAFIGVHNMARREESARQRAYREIIVSQMGDRLVAARRITVPLASSVPIASATGGELRGALGRAVVGNGEDIDAMLVTGGDGTLLAAFPTGTAPRRAARRAGESLARDGSGKARVYVETDAGEPQAWLIQRVRTDAGARYLWARVAVRSLLTVLSRNAGTDRGLTMAVVDAGGRVMWADGEATALKTAKLRFEPDETDPATGTVRLRGAGVSMVGCYGALADDLGLPWRVVVLEPADRAMRSTWGALGLSAVAWLAALLAAVCIALAAAAWVSRPLRELERQANALARGAHAEPLRLERHDELGRLAEAFNAVTSRLEQLGDVSEVLARSAEPEQVFDGIMTSVARILHASGVGLLVREEAGRGLRVVRASGLAEGELGTTVEVAEGSPLAEALANASPRRFAPDAADDLLLRRIAPPSGSGLVVPLAVGADPLGVIVALSDASDGFSDAEVEMARAFAAQASIAVHNSRLFARERSSRREAETLRAVAERIADPQEVQATIEAVLVLAREALEMPSAMLAVIDRPRYGLSPARDRDLEAQLLVAWREVPDSHAGVGPMVLHIETALPAVQSCMRRLAARTLLVVPVSIAEEPTGLLVLGSSSDELHGITRRLRIADAVATQLALALRNAALFEQARGRADDLETVFRISQAVSSSLDTKVVLNRVLDVVQKIFEADAVLLMTFDAERKLLTVPMARGLVKQDVLEMRFQSGEDLPGRVFASKQPERYETLDGIEDPFGEAMRRQGMGSLLAVPLLARGRSIGVLCLLAGQRAAFGESDMELLRTFAAQAALAIDTAGLFTREHHVAMVLQESILPTRLPQVDGIESSAIYLPAGQEAEIGGDYYDVFLAPDGRLVLAIGDVCGKGVVAATKTSMVRYAIRGMVAAGLQPDRILAEVNSMLVALDDASGIVTVWLGMLDIDDGTLRYADGGHPPALLMQPDGSLTRLATTGALLGGLDGAEYGLRTVTVQPGGVVLLYTDGVTEARNKARFFGEGRVRRALRAGGSTAAITQRLLAQVQRFCSGELRDDAAIVALRRTVHEDGDRTGR